MSGILGLQREISLKKTTNATAVVPNHDVCRLSYYLRCGTLSCGIKSIPSDLLDYNKAHRLPQHRQDTIFKLAYKDYGLEVLANATIFLDDEHKLINEDSSNDFFDVESVSSVFAASRHVLIAGQTRQVAEIMVCDTAWLTRNYMEPLQRNKARLRRILGPSPEDELADGLAKLYLEASKPVVQPRVRVTHPTVTCDACFTEGISGARYKCRDCFNYDLCEECYNNGEHNMTHSFKRFASAGSRAVVLQPRVRVTHPTVTCDACFTEGISGARYKCRDCFNYDLCEECYNNGEHNMTHSFKRFERAGSRAVVLQPRVRVTHPTVTCDACFTEGISGARYKCRDCFNYDLCEECYNSGAHNTSHSFERFARAGSRPVVLRPRLGW